MVEVPRTGVSVAGGLEGLTARLGAGEPAPWPATVVDFGGCGAFACVPASSPLLAAGIVRVRARGRACGARRTLLHP